MLATLCNQRVSHIGALSSSAGRAKLAWVTANAEVDRLRCAASRRCAAKILLTYISQNKVLFRSFASVQGRLLFWVCRRILWLVLTMAEAPCIVCHDLLSGLEITNRFQAVLNDFVESRSFLFKTDVNLIAYFNILVSFGVSV